MALPGFTDAGQHFKHNNVVVLQRHAQYVQFELKVGVWLAARLTLSSRQ